MGTVRFEMEANEAKAVRAWLKLTDAERKAEIQATKVSRATKRVGSDASKAGTDGARGFMSMAAGAVTMTAAMAAGAKALAALNAERKKAADLAKQDAQRLGTLAQLAEGDEKRMKALVGNVGRSRRQYGMSKGEAIDFEFGLQSYGEEKNRALYLGLYGVADPTALAEGAATLKASMGKKETGSSRAIANKLLLASSRSKVSLRNFAPEAARAAASVQQIGGSDEELLAMMAILTRSTKAPGEAATALAALAKAGAKKGVGTGGVMAAVDKLAPEMARLKQKDRATYLGSDEAVRAFATIVNTENRALIETTIEELKKADAATGSGDLVDRTKQAYNAIPELRAVRAGAIAKQRRLTKTEAALAVPELTRQRVLDLAEEQRIDQGYSDFRRWGGRKYGEALSWFGAPGKRIASELGVERWRLEGRPPPPKRTPAPGREWVPGGTMSGPMPFEMAKIVGMPHDPFDPTLTHEKVNQWITINNDYSHRGDSFANEVRPERLPPDAATVEIP